MTGKISLYIHVPFCTKKCPYCHFFVLPNSENAQTLFLTSLRRELQLRASNLQDKEIVSIYFGGGTPSLLPVKDIEEILSWIEKGPAKLSPTCEITLEANPESVSLSQMQSLKRIGVNRISMGVQSFDEALLRLLGRSHDKNKALDALDCIDKAGISNTSIDLMYELPYQTLSSWEKSLNALRNLPITHLSLYNLTFEPTTLFFKKQKELSPLLPSSEESLLMLNMAVENLKKIGLSRYEISAFAKPGYESIHNTGYWTGRPFLGLGPSAFSFWDRRRFKNISHLKKYADLLEKNTLPEDFEETLSLEDSQKELLAVELRLLKGVDLSIFQKKHSLLSPSLQKSIEKLLQKMWLEKRGDLLSLTPEGLLFYDSVGSELI